MNSIEAPTLIATVAAASPRISLAVRAWNEEPVISTLLESFFRQSLFEELARRGEMCEIVCIANGCTDRTAEFAERTFARQRAGHPFASAFACRVVEIATAGRNNTWNAFVHQISNPAAEILFVMDSDIVFDRPGTLFNMYAALRDHPQAAIAGDRPHKDLLFKSEKSLLDRLSLATSDMTRAIDGQITGQLYCIRAPVARRLYLPKDLGAPDDGFIKKVVCTDFFTKEMDSSKILIAEDASHIYEAYRSPGQILNNQKRQMIGQTTVHVLIEYLTTLDPGEKADLAGFLKRKDETDPGWLGRLMSEHLQRTRFFWRLFPDALTFRFARWWKLKGWRRVTHLPAALAGFAVTLIACLLAHQHLRGGLRHYWPKADRDRIKRVPFIVGEESAARREPALPGKI